MTRPCVPMDPILETLRQIPPSTLGHFLDDGFLDIEIRPIFRPITLVGRALPISAPPRDNAIYRQALRECRPGDVLVIHRRGDARHASFGGNLGLAAKPTATMWWPTTTGCSSSRRHASRPCSNRAGWRDNARKRRGSC